ncbi:uncharacterized protein BO87DRAFT_235680 [Aspergillus neoniger CBS 115656]|uniref:Uncharacterized protein n=1 Tax=Aspergillus neoniger (strain CBS 115656) TaxID=1448310 RepID=A0A318YPJ2_ASPNB|nr:hypothetical protein BO87DRAFT_235680 [Aspergillus neoniger CBS 115656]PYH36244.1 hypothetical protein BO87DRAFT_235680 [Aspergillus neoniger CBS 115656]
MMTFTFEALVIWVDLFSDSPFYSFLPFFFTICLQRENISDSILARRGLLTPCPRFSVYPISHLFSLPASAIYFILLLLLPSVAFIVPIRCNILHTPVILPIAETSPQSICAGHMYNLILPNFPNRCLISLCASSYFLLLLSVASTCA